VCVRYVVMVRINAQMTGQEESWCVCICMYVRIRMIICSDHKRKYAGTWGGGAMENVGDWAGDAGDWAGDTADMAGDMGGGMMDSLGDMFG
jgi:hypothetical protein